MNRTQLEADAQIANCAETTCCNATDAIKITQPNPMTSDELPPSSATPCGCEVDGEKFCNFDDGDNGFCEDCSNYEKDGDCFDDGLPTAGAIDCVQRCFPGAGDGTLEPADAADAITKCVYNNNQDVMCFNSDL